MNKNPYQTPQKEDAANSHGSGLKRIGFLTQVAAGCFLANLLLLFWAGFNSRQDPVAVFVIAEGVFLLVLVIASCASAGMLMYRLVGPLTGLAFGVGAVIPCVNIAVLAVAMQKGTYYLRRHGLVFSLTSFKIYPIPSQENAAADPKSPQRPSVDHVDRPAASITANRQVYEGNIPLDAEALAAGGIRLTYDSLLPTLQQFVDAPAMVSEQIDGYDGSYTVKFDDQRFRVTAPDLTDEGNQSSVRATNVLFHVVNQQLVDSPTKFYAIGEGRNLAGVFMTVPEYNAATETHADQEGVPYLPASPAT